MFWILNAFWYDLGHQILDTMHCLLSKSFPLSICPTLFYSFYVWIVKKILIQLFELMNNFSFFNFWEIMMMMKRVWWVGIEAIFLHFDRTLGKWDRTWKWGLIYIKVIQLSQCIPSLKCSMKLSNLRQKTKFANVYFLTAISQRICELENMNEAQWIKIFVSTINSWVR